MSTSIMARPATEQWANDGRDTLGRYARPATAFSLAVAEKVRETVWNAGFGPSDLPVITGLAPAEVNARWTDGNWCVDSVWRIADAIGVDVEDLFAELPWATTKASR